MMENKKMSLDVVKMYFLKIHSPMPSLQFTFEYSYMVSLTARRNI